MTNKGSVLIAVLWLLAMLSVFALAVSRQASQELLFGIWIRDRVIGRSLAKAGIQRALMEIRVDKFKTFDAYQESWGYNPVGFNDIEIPGGKFSVICEQDEEKAYGVCDESARINLNKATEDVLRNLFQNADSRMTVENARAIAQAVIDWRDQDDNKMEHGAESGDYTRYEPRNADLQSVEELTMINGVTPEIFEKIRPYATVYSKGPLNFNTASKTALRALGLSAGLAEKVSEFRRGGDNIWGTADDEIFQDISQIIPALGAVLSFSNEEFTQISSAVDAGQIEVRSDVFRVRAIGHLNREARNTDTMITCILNRSGSILYWNEGQEN